MRYCNFLIGLLAVAAISLSGCKDDESGGNVPPTNSAPGPFTVTISNVAETSASASWTAASDADGDNVTYEVILSDVSQATNLTNRSYSFSSLTEGTAYSGKVVASDGNGGTSEATFSFTTNSPTNSAPGSFSVTVSSITTNTASLTWTSAVDPDNDEILYKVRLGGTEMATNLSVTSYELTSLSASTSYNGKVIAEDGNGGISEASFSFTTEEETPSMVIDPSLFNNANFAVEAKLVNCTLDNGSTTQCYELTFISNPVNDDGPFCPDNTSQIGGMGIYDGTTNPGFQVMKAALFEAMENDGYDIITAGGNIRVGDFSSPENPSFSYCLEPLPNNNLTLTFTIPAYPEMATTNNVIETVEWLGVSLDGVPMNGTPPSVVDFGNGNIPSLDPCGGHHDPSGYYHWHFIPESTNEVLDAFNITEISCTNITQNSSALSGFAKDGFPIYASRDENGTLPNDLDECNGHTSATAEYPDGVYHYHASSTEAPNVPPCLKGATAANRFDVQ